MRTPAATIAQPRSALGLAAAAPTPVLRADEVDVWHASLDAQTTDVVPFMQTLLSADEAERAQRFYFERDRRRFIVGRGILRTLLGRYLEMPAQKVALCYGAHGKPMLADAGVRSVYFNAAHSEGLVVFAFAVAGEVGIDVERIREIPEWETIATAYFGPREVSRLRGNPPEARRVEFFRAWTRQEALLKAHGIGLGENGARIGSPDRPAGGGANAAVARPELERAFNLHPLETEPGFAAALAVPPGVQWMTSLAWQPDAGAQAGPQRPRRTRLKNFSATASVSS
jgi:4'-phosphopantetheinyl transferase